MAHQHRSAAMGTLRVLEAGASELWSRVSEAWDRLAAAKPFDAYEREKTLEDVDRALALAFKMTDIFSEVGSELRRNRLRQRNNQAA